MSLVIQRRPLHTIQDTALSHDMGVGMLVVVNLAANPNDSRDDVASSEDAIDGVVDLELLEDCAEATEEDHRQSELSAIKQEKRKNTYP